MTVSADRSGSRPPQDSRLIREFGIVHQRRSDSSDAMTSVPSSRRVFPTLHRTGVGSPRDALSGSGAVVFQTR